MIDGETYELPTLGAFLRRSRENREYTRKVAAKHLHVGETTLQRLEVGDSEHVAPALRDGLIDLYEMDSDAIAHLDRLLGQPPVEHAAEMNDSEMLAMLNAFGDGQTAVLMAHWRMRRTTDGRPLANDNLLQLMPGAEDAPSYAHWFFGDPRARLSCLDWWEEARFLTGQLRQRAADANWRPIVQDLLDTLPEPAYPVLKKLWDSHVLAVRGPNRVRRFWRADIEQEVWVKSRFVRWPAYPQSGSVLIVGRIVTPDPPGTPAAGD